MKNRSIRYFIVWAIEGAAAVLASTNITAEERKDYLKVVEKFDAFFRGRRNVIFERARFYRRYQREGEPVDTGDYYLHHGAVQTVTKAHCKQK